jgi:two-component system, cell cycle response regulator
MADKLINAHILVIASDMETRQTLKALLQGTGFTAHFSPTAEDGLFKAAEQLPAVIVLDIDIHNINSFETCRRLRSNRSLEGIPIVMLCDREQRDLRAGGLNAGADDFLEKPFDGLEVMSRLGSLARLNSRSYLMADLTRFSWMVEHAREGYLMLDKSGMIHYANESALNLLNMPEDYFGLPFVNVVERRYLPEPIETWQNWLSEPDSCFIVQPESPTARAVWVVLESLETTLGTGHYRIVRLRDVTERMSIYQDMRKFHTVISHKLRTPMAMLMTSVSIIKNQLDSLSPEELKKMLGSTIKGTDRLAGEIRSILTYIDAPLALNVGKPMILGELPEIVQAIRANLQIHNVNFSLPESLNSLSIAMTPDAVEMVLPELLENARKFHPNHEPKIEISVGQVDEDFIFMRVADNGATLSTEQLQWAWLPYFQGEKDFTGELPGLGLGFPMVATLIWKSGGAINLRNRSEGPGIIVDLKIPLESTMRNMERSAAPYGS